MKLNDTFDVTTDGMYNFILIELYETKVKTIATKERYYPNLELLYKDAVKLGIMRDDLKDLKLILNKLDVIHRDINKQLKEIAKNGGIVNDTSNSKK